MHNIEINNKILKEYNFAANKRADKGIWYVALKQSEAGSLAFPSGKHPQYT